MWRIDAIFEDGSSWEGSDIGIGGEIKTMGIVTLLQ
jgi:hypothetical protein